MLLTLANNIYNSTVVSIEFARVVYSISENAEMFFLSFFK